MQKYKLYYNIILGLKVGAIQSIIQLRGETPFNPSTMKIKSLIYSRRIIVSDTRKKINGAAVTTARFSNAVAGQLNK